MRKVEAIPEFTEQQIEDFKAFEAAAKKPAHERQHSHTDPRSSGLDRERHRFVLQWYSHLRAKVHDCDHQGRPHRN